MAWDPPVETREHPMGEPGVLSSLDEVAKAASRGSTDPRVRTWAIERLDIARGGGRSVKEPHERAAVLLEAVQQKLWTPDPVGAEYIPAAHLLACDPNKVKPGQVCLRGDDCDGLSTLLGAAISSVGIYTLIVGHAYGKPQIEHVLCAAYLPKVGGQPWKYADPSSKYPLGKCHAFTRERLIAIPSVKLLCDSHACIGRQQFDPDKLGFIEQGEFVGVGELPPLDGLSAEVVWEVAEEPVGELMRAALGRLRVPL